MAWTDFVAVDQRTAKRLVAFLLFGAIVGVAQPGHGESLQLLIEGTGNNVLIDTPAENGARKTGGNTLYLSILGDRNGGEGRGWSDTTLFAGFPDPGIVLQSGFDNKIVLDVTGQENLFSVVQSGNAHSLVGVISGFGNSAAITQTGLGHRASFSQRGTGNALAISQSSW